MIASMPMLDIFSRYLSIPARILVYMAYFSFTAGREGCDSNSIFQVPMTKIKFKINAKYDYDVYANLKKHMKLAYKLKE